MKIINEKGKLFGLINIVDLIIILALLAVIGAVGVKLLAKPVGETISPKSEMIVTMRVRGAMLYFTAEIMKIEPGEKLVSGNSYVEGGRASSACPMRFSQPPTTGESCRRPRSARI